MDVLKNKRYKEYNRLSRYASFPYYYNTLDQKYVTGTPTNLNPKNEYVVYEVKSEESYDIIALKMYNNPTYFWIICNFNNIIDPFINPPIGSYLRIPIISTLEFIR